MNEDRTRILSMLASGKITAEEAEELLDALRDGAEGDTPAPPTRQTPATGVPKFIYVMVTSEDRDNVDIKVPLSLLRAGLRLTSLIPPQALDQINDSMEEHGMSIDFSNLKPDDIEELIAGLSEMEIKVDSKNGDNVQVRVYCA